MLAGPSAFLAVLMLAAVEAPGSAPREPSLGLKNALREAEAEVEKMLALAEKAISDGDLRGGLRCAEEADALSQRALHPVNAGRIKAARVLAGVRYRIAGKEGDAAAALRWSGEASQTALDRDDLGSAWAWAVISDELARQSLPEGDPGRSRAALRSTLVRCSMELRANSLQKAGALAEAALLEAGRTLPPGDRDRARASILLADIKLKQGDPTGALAQCERAIEEGKATQGAAIRARVEADFVAALICFDHLRKGGDEAAARLLVDASRLPDAWDPLAVTASHVVISKVWIRILKEIEKGHLPAKADSVEAVDPAYRAAEGRLVDALDGFRGRLQAAGAGPETASLGMLFLAKFQYGNRRIADCEKTLDALARDGGPGAVPNFAGDYWSLRGLVATERADFATARDCQDRAFGIYFRARLPQLALTLNNLGILLLRQGDYQLAEAILREADDYYARDPILKGDPQRAFVLTHLAKCLEWGNAFPEALRRHRQALEIARAEKPPNAQLICNCLNNLGINRYGVGEFDDAKGQFEEARDVAIRAFGEGHFHVAEIDVNLAWLAQARGRPEESERLFHAALGRFRELGDDHPRVAEALSYRARALARSGKKDGASRDLNEALDLQELALARTLRSPLSERDRLAIVQELRVHPESSAWPGVLDTFLELAPELGVRLEDQYRRLLTWKGVVAQHVRPRADQLEGNPEVQRLARDRDSILDELRDVSLRGSGGRGLPAGRSAVRLESEIENLERELARISPRFARGGEGLSPTPDQVARALPPRSALLDVIEVRRYRPDEAGEITKDFRYVAFLTRPDRPLLRVDLPEPAVTINRAIVQFRGDIEAHRDTSGSGAELARMVRDPLLPHLDGVDLLILAGDDLLNYLPLGALPGSKPHSFWVEEIAFASVSGAQSLVGRRERGGSPAEGALIVGGVDYVAWERLKGTLEEAEEIGRIYAGAHPGRTPADLLSGPVPTVGKLRDILPRRRYVHLATHGFFHAAKGDSLFSTHGASAEFDSGIVLAGPEGGGGDDVLTAEEIGRLDLRGTELVVLSACESGLGRLRAGQGVIGLVGALDRAGVASVVSTLWKVSDEATAPFMASFYRHLWADPDRVGPARALRAAQVEMIRGTLRGKSGGSYSHPFYWAAFVQGGDPSSAPRP